MIAKRIWQTGLSIAVIAMMGAPATVAAPG